MKEKKLLSRIPAELNDAGTHKGEDADRALSHEISCLIDELSDEAHQTRALHVVIISSDHDFIREAKTLRVNGFIVTVIGNLQKCKALAEHANEKFEWAEALKHARWKCAQSMAPSATAEAAWQCFEVMSKQRNPTLPEPSEFFFRTPGTGHQSQCCVRIFLNHAAPTTIPD